jgi:tRNA G18 (ribose-2'-O)-methylase SpoU
MPRIRLEALLDNIRSAWNVGAIFRTADCLGVDKLYLCGITPTPENESVQKTSLGAESSVKWEYARNALLVAERLKAEGVRLWALEQDARSNPLGKTDAEANRETNQRMVLIVGNEVTGVDPALLDLCERIVHIPMRGSKRSLNVEVAFGVAVSALVNERDK